MKIHVKVKPNSGKQEIIKVSDAEYKINLKERAENNKANIELMKLLKKYFKKDIKIISGKSSRNKLIEVKEGQC